MNTYDEFATRLAVNNHFLFFTTTANKVYFMNKHGYSQYHYELANIPGEVSSMITYRDELLMLAERDLVSYIDVSDIDETNGKGKKEKIKLMERLPNGNSVE